MRERHSSENYLDIITKPFYKINTSVDEEKFNSIIEEIQKNRHLKKYHTLIFKDNSIGKKYLIDNNEKFFRVEKKFWSHYKNNSGMIYFSIESLKCKNLFTEENLERKENLFSFILFLIKNMKLKNFFWNHL